MTYLLSNNTGPRLALALRELILNQIFAQNAMVRGRILHDGEDYLRSTKLDHLFTDGFSNKHKCLNGGLLLSDNSKTLLSSTSRCVQSTTDPDVLVCHRSANRTYRN